MSTQRTRPCDKCGRAIRWVRDAEGKPVPLDEAAPVYMRETDRDNGVSFYVEVPRDIAGVLHFRTCPNNGRQPHHIRTWPLPGETAPMVADGVDTRRWWLDRAGESPLTAAEERVLQQQAGDVVAQAESKQPPASKVDDGETW